MSAGVVRALGRALARPGRRLPAALVRSIDEPASAGEVRLLDRPPGRRAVVVAPHPDDELLGCGGTIQKHLAAGEQVDVVFMTSGERTASFVGAAHDARIEQREGEAVAACAHVGLAAAHLHFLRAPDGDAASGREALAGALQRLAPDLLYVPNPRDPHRDHVATARIASELVAEVPSIVTVAVYEVWSPIRPNVVVDVSDQLDAKVEAVGMYASATEVVGYPHTSRGLAAYRAGLASTGARYAEVFTLRSPARASS